MHACVKLLIITGSSVNPMGTFFINLVRDSAALACYTAHS